MNISVSTVTGTTPEEHSVPDQQRLAPCGKIYFSITASKMFPQAYNVQVLLIRLMCYIIFPTGLIILPTLSHILYSNAQKQLQASCLLSPGVDEMVSINLFDKWHRDELIQQCFIPEVHTASENTPHQVVQSTESEAHNCTGGELPTVSPVTA